LKATLLCGLNRQVKDKEISVDFQRPFDILLKFKVLQNDSDVYLEEKRKGRTSKKPERPVWSGFLNEVRTFNEKKFCLQAENSIKNK